MEEQNAHLRINLTTREIEIEGSETFVREYAEKLESLLSVAAESSAVTNQPQQSTSNPPQVQLPPKELPPVFGEYLHLFPKSITDMDKILIAAYYVQAQDADNSFTTRAANQLLKEQNIKVTNAADCVKKSMKTKRVFALGKGRFRVSQAGIDYINGLFLQE